MLRRFWHWLVGPSAPPSGDAVAGLEERVEELEDRYNRLTRRFDRMQGEFNALNRSRADEDDEEVEEDVYS